MKHYKTQVILNPSCILSHPLLTVLLAGSSTCPAKPTSQVFSAKSHYTSVKGYFNQDTGLHIPCLWIPHLPAGVILSSLINISNSACILHSFLASTSLCTLYKEPEGNKRLSCLLRRWELSSSSHTADRCPSCCRTHAWWHSQKAAGTQQHLPYHYTKPTHTPCRQENTVPAGDSTLQGVDYWNYSHGLQFIPAPAWKFILKQKGFTKLFLSAASGSQEAREPSILIKSRLPWKSKAMHFSCWRINELTINNI